MLEFDVYLAISALSGLVIVSYLFSLVSAKTRIPTVLMLLLLGVGIRELLMSVGRYVEIPLDFIQFFGVLGLILVLLEAGLDLNLSRAKLPLMRRAVTSATFMLALTAVGIALVMHLALELSWLRSFVYAVPLAVISSTIVASSIGYLSEDKREFLTYESSISDVLGILVFNLLIAGEALNAGAIALNVGSIVLALALSVVVSVLLVVMLAKTTMPIKAFLVIAVLLLIYSLGHTWQLPTLFTVLIFGLIINNWGKSKFRPLHGYLKDGSVEKAAQTVKFVNAESAFLVRTLFFTMFGYMIDVRMLANPTVLLVGSAVVAVIFAARLLYLWIFNRNHVLPELFFAPRGLVTIVLFYSIPSAMTVTAFDDGVVFFVVMVTTVVMTVGSVWFTPRGATRADEEARARVAAEESEASHGTTPGTAPPSVPAAESPAAESPVEAPAPADQTPGSASAPASQTAVPAASVPTSAAWEARQAPEAPESQEALQPISLTSGLTPSGQGSASADGVAVGESGRTGASHSRTGDTMSCPID
ncbi:MAG TPA: cation:proton antiporter [Ruania sp.]|nr:cation:proton antiporter [Ruania sp.]